MYTSSASQGASSARNLAGPFYFHFVIALEEEWRARKRAHEREVYSRKGTQH